MVMGRIFACAAHEDKSHLVHFSKMLNVAFTMSTACPRCHTATVFQTVAKAATMDITAVTCQATLKGAIQLGFSRAASGISLLREWLEVVIAPGDVVSVHGDGADAPAVV